MPFYAFTYISTKHSTKHLPYIFPPLSLSLSLSLSKRGQPDPIFFTKEPSTHVKGNGDAAPVLIRSSSGQPGLLT